MSEKTLYVILWGVAAVIATGMTVADDYENINHEKRLIKSGTDSTEWITSDAINNLLLTGNDFKQDEQNSFINLYLKSDNLLNESEVQDSRESVYSQIFRKKVASINKKTIENRNIDFTIKPIPK